MPLAIPRSVINAKEKETGKLNAHHALEKTNHAISAAGGDIMQPSVQARGKARVTEAKVRVMESEFGARAAKVIGPRAKEIGAREEKDGVVAEEIGAREEKAKVSRERLREMARETEEKRARA